MKHLQLYENFDRYNNKILDLSTLSYAYHWVNEGLLFDQIYNTDKIDTEPYILRKNNGKKIDMPALPELKMVLGEDEDEDGDGVCMTVDSNYVGAGYTGESNICIVFDMLDLLKNFNIKNLTDNHEAEIRIQSIPEWDKFAKKILIVKKVYETGDGWEGYFYRAVKEWFPEKLKSIVEVHPSQGAIGKALDKQFHNSIT